MSLIQEALKRQQEEAKASQPTSKPGAPPERGLRPKVRPPPASAPDSDPESPPAAPPPLPPEVPRPVAAEENTPEPEAEPADGSRRSPWVLVGIAAAILVLGAGGLFAARFLVRQRSAPGALLEGAQAAAAAVSDPARTAAVAQAAMPEQPPAVPPTPPAQPQATTTGAPPVSALAPPPKPVTKWPALALTAIAGRGSRGSAVINGKPILVGETVESVTLVSIGEGVAQLEYQGGTQTLRVGNSLP
jgi:hypothetical protein